jgi:hypothetical protein
MKTADQKFYAMQTCHVLFVIGYSYCFDFYGVKVYVGEEVCQFVKWIQLDRDWFQCQALVNFALNLWISKKC